jgi:hypothetical protein
MRSTTHAIIEPKSGLYSGVDYQGMPVVILKHRWKHLSLFFFFFFFFARTKKSKEAPTVKREEPRRILTAPGAHGHNRQGFLSENPYWASNSRVSFPACKELSASRAMRLPR